MDNQPSLEKRQFSTLFLWLTILLMTLPLFITSQDLITKLLESSGLSTLIQNYVIPIEVKFVVATLSLIGVPATGDTRIIVLFGQTREAFRAQIIWSCIGWQSVVLFLVTLITGFSGKYTISTKLETIVIGLMGTFWVNILRIVIIYLLGFYFGRLPAVLFHNFAGTLMVVIWLFFFWWFAYRFILEEKQRPKTIPNNALQQV